MAENAALSYETDSARPRLLIGRASIAAAGTAYEHVLTFISGMIIARVIGASQFGIYNLARNLLDIGRIITRLGLQTGLQRHFGEVLASNRRREANLLLRRVRIVADVVALLPPLVLALGAGSFLEAHVYPYSGFATVLLGLALALPFMTDLGVLGGAYRGILKLAPAIVAECVILPTLRLAIILVLFAAGWRLWAVVAGTTLASLIASGFLAVRARRDFSDAAPAGDQPWAEVYRVIAYSSVLAGALLVGTTTRAMDVLLLGHFVPAQSLGQYTLIKTLLISITILGTAFNQALGPLVAERHARGDHIAMIGVISLVARWLTLGTLPVFAVFLIWGSKLVLIFGESFAMPQSTVSWLAAGQFVFVIAGPCGWALSMTGRQTLEFMILAAGLVLSAVLCWLAIPQFGQLGAAVATFSMLIIVNAAKMIAVRRFFGVWPIGGVVIWGTAGGIALAWVSEVAVAALELDPTLHTATAITFFLLSYALAAWVLFLQPSERAGIRDAMANAARTLSKLATQS